MNTRRLLLGMLAGNAVGAVLCLLVRGIVALVAEEPPMALFPSLVLVPLSIGFVAMWVWKPLDLSLWKTLLHSLTCTALGLGGAAVFFREGAICLLIAFPLFYAGVLCGALGARLWIIRNNDRLRISFLPLAVLAIVVEPMLRGPHTGVVTDELLIQAPPARVWPHVLAFPAISEAPAYWLFRLGLPYPMFTTNDGDQVGASRACVFSGGAVFEETIVEFDPRKRLTFDIVKSPPDPELLGHLDAQRGRFELRDNGDGTTTLIGSTWYALHVRPAWYFDGWTHDIFRAVHLRVMNHVKRLAETGA